MQIKEKLVAMVLLMTMSVGVVLTGCGGSGGSDDSSVSTDTSSSSDSDSSDSDSSDSDSSDSDSSDSDSSDSEDYSAVTAADCEGDTDIETVVCAAEAFIDTLTSDEQDSLLYDWSESEARTVWSNLPVGAAGRNGLRFGDLDSESRLAAVVVARALLSDAGYEDFLGVMAADDYLGEVGNSSTYSSNNYYIAFFGYPDVSGDWMIQIGGHHMAYNVTYLSGTGYPTPNHIAAEPKGSFEINSTSYAPVSDEGDAMVAMFDALSSSELEYAYLEGQSFSDVLMGPDNGSGELPTDYPEGSDRGGILVSYLSEDQQALVTAAIEQWVNDFSDDVSQELLATYTSADSYADTYIAWGGSESAGVDVDTAGTYLRIDGPRLWIELACQSGVVISGKTHYHTMYRDKTMDYGNSL